MLSKALTTAAAGSAGGDYTISKSLRFNSADSAYLSRTPASAGNRKTWTWSGWVKRSALGSGTYEVFRGDASTGGVSLFTGIRFIGDKIYIQDVNSGSYNIWWVTSAVFRDPSAWYHIVVKYDTTQASSSNATSLWVNGVLQTLTFTTYSGSYSQNRDSYINATNGQYLGAGLTDSGVLATNTLFPGYLADINFIDGQALTPSSFGEVDSVTGVWKPIRYAGSYGTNGFKLSFSDSSNTTAATLGADSSGNGNNWTPSGSPGFSVAAGAGNDSLVDSPTQYGTDTGAGGEVRGNYCTWNPLDKSANGTAYSLVNGNLDANSASTQWENLRATMGMTTGKWYWEVTITSSPYNDVMVGVVTTDAPLSTRFYQALYGYFWRCTDDVNDVAKWNNNTSAAYGTTVDLNDVVGVAFNADNGELTFYKNGSSQGIAYTVTTGLIYAPALNGNGDRGSVTVNFGQRPFAYTAPSGFKALCTQNLPDPTILQGDQHFNTVLYSGNGTSQSITGVGFQPDFTWIKSRNVSATYHQLWDSIRGTSKVLFSNDTLADYTRTDGLTSFDSDGFSVGSHLQNNGSGYTFVAWNWKANGAGSSNTDGTITSTVSANTTAGISIVTYTGNGTAGATVGHGLGVTPDMLIFKNRDNTDGWIVFHRYVGGSDDWWDSRLLLASTAARADNAGYLTAAPTSTLLTLSNTTPVNTSTEKYILYCFASISGFSAFGSYTGNGSADGPFVYTGFRPAWVMIKNVEQAGGQWFIYDDIREPYNPNNSSLFAESSQAETANNSALDIDFLSNGWKIKNTGSGFNNSGIKYIFAAFSSNPFKYSLAR